MFDNSNSFNSTNTTSLNAVDGTWYLHVQAKDLANNVSEVTTVSAILDNTPPVAELANPPESPSNLNYATLTVTGTDVVDYKGSVKYKMQF